MKKTKFVLAIFGMPLLMNSCIVASHHYTTGNPIGTKKGYVKSSMIGDFDAGLAAAAKKGKISKIGSVDIKVYAAGRFSVNVTGE